MVCNKREVAEIQNYSVNYLVALKRGGEIHIAMFTDCNGKHWWTYDDVTALTLLPEESYKVEGSNKDDNNNR